MAFAMPRSLRVLYPLQVLAASLRRNVGAGR